MVVELHESGTSVTDIGFNETGYPNGTAPALVVRAEEALIVLMVLVLWAAAIALFFNRWGKIRMLEPYQPKFQHRASCPLVDSPLPGPPPRASFSKFTVNLGEPSLFPSPAGVHSVGGLNPGCNRPRQNSVFVGSSSSVIRHPMNPPRKTRSAVDIHSLVLTECGPPISEASGSQFQSGQSLVAKESYATHV